ncbi:DUF3696 domain-containing protein [Pedobacter metabolipauper]|uniref:Uncharacterized protein DUF3696 n=1 Tax=Pedobacter metabolipauper TaxID=425513 RepID=A0A4R6SRG8_9SPHI|nr:DUF3696 domain-containing protein [Pedobacter metabolipauper]TDQ06240.1 uncharacterized protein DUF3696 [Pedobacter metabolipauper]
MFSLTLENFRSFKKQTFDFSKFNILIGENSSGKSSILKFLLALKQSFQTPASREINLLFKGEFADLGSYKESIYYQDENLPLSFTFLFDEKYLEFFKNFMTDNGEELEDRKILDRIFDIPNLGETSVRYELTRELNDHNSIKTNLKCAQIGDLFIYHFPEESLNDKTYIYRPRCSIRYLDYSENMIYEFIELEYQKDGFMTLITAGSLLKQIRKSLNISNSTLDKPDHELTAEELTKKNKCDTIFNKIAYLLISQNYLRYFLDRIDYINPINTHPSRVYLLTDQRRISSVKDLDDVIEFFSRRDKFTLAVFDDFVQILRDLGIAQNLEIIQDERLPVRELRVKVKDLLSNIKDVGYGVSLQLPIILKALLADRIARNKNTIIMIEQPEVHLHPRLHAELINALLKLSKNTTYFIETHSEHIIRKLQVLVKEESHALNADDVTIHYLLRVEHQSEVTHHKIESNGLLNPQFPSGFFDNSFTLAKQLLD